MSSKASFIPDVKTKGYGFSALPLSLGTSATASEPEVPGHCLAVFKLDRIEGKKYWTPFGVYRIEDVQAQYEGEEEFYEAIESGRLYTRAGPFLLVLEARTMRLLSVDFTTDLEGKPTEDAILNWMHIERTPRTFPEPLPIPDPAMYHGGD